MLYINEIESWYNACKYTYNPNDIFLIHIKKDVNVKGRYPDTLTESENNWLIIKPLSKIKQSDIEASIKFKKQLILYFDKPIPLTALSVLKHSNYKYVYFDLGISNQYESLISFQDLDPINIIQNYMLYIKVFFEIILNNSKNKKSIFTPSTIDIFLLRNKKNLSFKTINDDDIILLEHYNKLTSRLAIIIYKICTFDFNASEKEIGLYFSKIYGKSKPLNKKSCGIQNLKGYDINAYSDDPIYTTKVQIAQQLSSMQNQLINQNTILHATGIDINNLQKHVQY